MSESGKIGIRPVIDGRRRGVRESLETQTLNMAGTAAHFLTRSLRHPNGLPVECVIADTTIGGAAEAAMCAGKFSREGVAVSLTVTPCWCYGTEVMDSDPLTFKAVWGFNGTERPGAVYLAAALAGYNQKGRPCFSIYGRDVQDFEDSSGGSKNRSSTRKNTGTRWTGPAKTVSKEKTRTVRRISGHAKKKTRTGKRLSE